MSESTAIVQAQANTWKGALEPELFRARGMLQRASKFSEEDTARLITCVQIAARKAPKLLLCEPKSVALAVAQAASLRIFPNTPVNHAYLIPYGKECQFQISYPGLIVLAKRTGLVSVAKATAVYASDFFELEEGTNPKVTHRPALRNRGGDKDIIGAYGLVQYKDGSTQFRWMNRDDLDKRRAMSKGADGADSPWNKWFKEMCEAKALKYTLRQCDMSNEDGERLMIAVNNDDRQEAGEPIDVSYIEGAEDLAPATAAPKGLAERASQ